MLLSSSDGIFSWWLISPLLKGLRLLLEIIECKGDGRACLVNFKAGSMAGGKLGGSIHVNGVPLADNFPVVDSSSKQML